ncbi:MAG: helix-turn-helix transcriptional regulator [Bacteroidetes bacterium]|nr:helix-turn-helix transcriptional regulator [Bacteroidota bacterium]
MAKQLKEDPKTFVEKVILKIKNIRKSKGYSLEYMAETLNLSVSGYNKIENNSTSITLERIIQIQSVLEVSLGDLLEIKGENNYTQTLNDHSVGHQQIEHLYQENKQVLDKLVNAYKDEIAFLRSSLKINLP